MKTEIQKLIDNHQIMQRTKHKTSLPQLSCLKDCFYNHEKNTNESSENLHNDNKSSNADQFRLQFKLSASGLI